MFFQMQGDTYRYASEVPASIRSSICIAAVKAMAKVHSFFGVAGGQKKQDGQSSGLSKLNFMLKLV